MMYQIIYAEGRCSNMANSRKDLRDWLKLLKDEAITDIRKVYKNGVSVSIKKSPGKFGDQQDFSQKTIGN